MELVADDDVVLEAVALVEALDERSDESVCRSLVISLSGLVVDPELALEPEDGGGGGGGGGAEADVLEDCRSDRKVWTSLAKVLDDVDEDDTSELNVCRSLVT